MGIIHFIGGEKGGVGKSFFTKILVSHYLSEGKHFAIYDCDDVNRDIYRVYEGMVGEYLIKVEQILFSKAEKELSLPNKLIYAADESDVIVNLPAGVHKLVGEWFKLSRVQEQADEVGTKLFLWYVCDGDITNLRLYGESRVSIPIQHIFVKNMVRLDKDEWELAIQRCEAMGYELKLSETAQLEIGKLGYWEAQALSQNYLSFENVQRDDYEGLGRVEKSVIRYYLRDCLRDLKKLMSEKLYLEGGELQKGMTPLESLEKQYKENEEAGLYEEVKRRDSSSGERKRRYEYVVMNGDEEHIFETESGAKEYARGLAEMQGLEGNELEKAVKERVKKRQKREG